MIGKLYTVISKKSNRYNYVVVCLESDIAFFQCNKVGGLTVSSPAFILLLFPITS